jgi:hypothetical protein
MSFVDPEILENAEVFVEKCEVRTFGSTGGAFPMVKGAG